MQQRPVLTDIEMAPRSLRLMIVQRAEPTAARTRPLNARVMFELHVDRTIFKSHSTRDTFQGGSIPRILRRTAGPASRDHAARATTIPEGPFRKSLTKTLRSTLKRAALSVKTAAANYA